MERLSLTATFLFPEAREESQLHNPGSCVLGPPLVQEDTALLMAHLVVSNRPSHGGGGEDSWQGRGLEQNVLVLGGMLSPLPQSCPPQNLRM